MARPQGGASARRRSRRALDRRLPDLRDLACKATPPRGGWVRAIREALGMSAADLGQRMGVAETSVLSLEHNEVTRRVRLDTLERAADALNCELVYALVPRRPLEQMVDERARSVAGELLGSVGHSMALEGQQVSPSVTQDQLLEQALRLRDEPGLWRDER
jgi:predicted DNA-binding mobile mystery protein A